MDLMQHIKHQAASIHQQTVERRRYMHAHPELSFHETETAKYIASELENLQIPFQRGIGGNGLVGLIEGKKGSSGKVVALRADFDALPIIEENDVPYKSQNQGVMHACGHDAHTASLLGTAEILKGMVHEFDGTIKLIFQPAEEKFPGGASLMIKDGALRQPQVGGIIGQHVLPYMDVGKIGIRKGMYMASADEIYLTIRGKGGHAALPSKFIDPVMITAQTLVTLQQVVSRSDPRVPSVLSFGYVEAKGATNVIPDEVHVMGTFRTMNEEWRKQAHQKMESIVRHTVEALGGKAELEIRKGYPVLFNDEVLTDRVHASIKDYMGEENVVDLDLWMAAEDFSYYTHEIPGCFYRLGTRNEARGIVHGLHTPKFDIDESAFGHSTGLMAWLAL
ncbi:MAG: amidohydrolase, partial [Bacteroidota bacterium]